MPAIKYTFERGGPARVEISWSGIWKNVRVRLDGNELGTISNQVELQDGRRFVFTDGHQLSVQLLQRLPGGLEVLFDGQPLVRSAAGPEEKLKYTSLFIYFLAALNIVVGALAELLQVPILLNAGIGSGSLILGLLFAVLGWFVQRRSIIALSLIVFLFALDGIMSAVNGNRGMVGAIVGRAFLILIMMPAFSAIRALRNQRSQSLLKHVPLPPPVVAHVEPLLEEVSQPGNVGPKILDPRVAPKVFNPKVSKAGWIVGALILVAIAVVAYAAMQPAGSAR